MGIGRDAQPLRILQVTSATLVYLEFTSLSGVLTDVKVPPGWALADFSSGVAALTFPTDYDVFFPFEGQENTDNASATSRHRLVTKTIDVTLGTASVRAIDDNDATTENPVDGTFRLCYLVGN
jgi:hypothetical protein